MKIKITWDICSAAATLGLTTSTFPTTRVFGTEPSVWKKHNNENMRSNEYNAHQ